MRKYATPTLLCTLQYRNGEVASDFEFDFLIFTIQTEKIKLEKPVQFSEVKDGKFTVRFTQEETGSLEGMTCEYQLNIMVGDDRIPTDIKQGKVQRNLHNEVIIV